MCYKSVFVEPASTNQQNDTTYSQFPKATYSADLQQSNTETQFPDYAAFSNEYSPLDLFDPLSFFNDSTSPMSVTSDVDYPVTDFYNTSPGGQEADYGSKPVFRGYASPPEYAYTTDLGLSGYPGYLLEPQFSQISPNNNHFAVMPAKSLRVNNSTMTLCKVCGDIASGNHFGVLSCEACKSFFRRSVRSNARYACRASRRCTIEKLTRNRCQYCRLQKCILMGMKKEVVQEERVPPPESQLHSTAASQTLSENSHVNDNLTHSSCSVTTTNEPTNLISKSRMGIHSSLPNLKITEMIPSSVSSSPNPSNYSSPVTPNSAESHSEVSASILVNADVQTDIPPEKVISAKGSVTVEELFEGARQSLMKVIDWGKRIPAFTALNLQDRMNLLKSSWFEHVLLRLAMRIRPESGTILLGSGITCFKDQIEDPEICRIIEQVSNDISYWFNTMQVDHVEMACLKGIILFNPDATGLSPGTRKRVEIFQEQILQALETRCRTIYPVTPLRFSKLLLRLAPLRAVALEATQHMEIQRTLGNTKIDDIFAELLDFN